MTSYRQARPEDLYHMGLTNLDPLTENYDVNFYLNYMMTWPELFIVAREKGGDIVGYGKYRQAHYLYSYFYRP